MEDPKTDQSPAANCSTPAPGTVDDLPPQAATESCEEKPDKEDPDSLRQPKRRKNCPTALDKFDSVNSATNLGFSFSFDSKFSGCSTPEVTPKFGSFNRVKPKPVSSKDPESEERELKEDEERADVIEKKKNSLGLLSSVDGIKTVD